MAIGISAVDHLLSGGFAHGVLTEIVARPSGGRFSTLLAALQQITSMGEPAALIDQGAHLDPQWAADIGVDLERVLWVRSQLLPDTLSAAEILIATGFSVVAIDLGLPPVRGRATLAAWIRLARRTAEHHAITLVGSPYRLSGCAAGTVLTAGRTRGRWQGRSGETRVLAGLTSSFRLSKRRGRASDIAARLALTLPEAAFAGTSEEFTSPRKEKDHVQTV